MMGDKRLIFVLGKGGAGKTTVSAALALAAVNQGKRTLVLEITRSNALAGLLGIPVVDDLPKSVMPNLWIARIDPIRELEAYLKNHLGDGFLTRKFIQSRLFESIVEATPGLREVMIMGAIWRRETETELHGKSRFDTIIVDAPATGHGIYLLRQPRALADMLVAGPIARQAETVHEMIIDTSKTGMILVTLAEELPVNETIAAMNALIRNPGIHLLGVVVNKVYPSRFTDGDVQRIRNLNLPQSGEKYGCILDAIANITQMQLSHRHVQEGHIQKLVAAMGGDQRLHFIPFLYRNRLSIENIHDIAKSF